MLIIVVFFGQEQVIQSQECGPLDNKVYIDALEKTRRLPRDEVIDAQNISSKP